MVTRIEQFSTELWLEVFSYLNVRHQFNAFYDLNQRFNQILFSHRHQIAWKNADADAQHLLEHVLPFLTKREQIAALQLENMKGVRSLVGPRATLG